jgi:hypothetical protein
MEVDWLFVVEKTEACQTCASIALRIASLQSAREAASDAA